MKPLGRVMAMEFRKAFLTKKFWLGMALLLLFAALSAVYMIENNAGYNPDGIISEYMTDGEFIYNPDLPLCTFYNSWVGGEYFSLAAKLFYKLLPVGAVLPFGWSYYVEQKSGYLKNIYSRVDKKTYLAGKTIAVFLSGAAVVAISLAVNLLLVFAKIPLITPFAGYNFYNMVYFGTLWADLYFTMPGLFVLLYALLDVVYGGLFALVSFAAGFFVRNLFAVLLLPFLCMMAASYIESVVQSNLSIPIPLEFVPVNFLYPQSPHFLTMAWAVFLVTAVLLAFSLLTVHFRGVRNETL